MDERKYNFMRILLYSLGLATLLATTLAEPNQLTQEEKSAGWQLLFDGKTGQGWRSMKQQTFPERGWVVENGSLKLEAGSRPGDLISQGTYSEFDLHWEWRIPSGANNGLKYFIIEERGGIGHEYQMIDDQGTKSIPEHSTASLYDVLAPNPGKPLRPPGEWNQSRILVKGQTVQHWLNGEMVLEYELGSSELLKAVQDSKFKSVPGFGTRVKGHILLTDHNDQAEYRNIKILPLAN